MNTLQKYYHNQLRDYYNRSKNDRKFRRHEMNVNNYSYRLSKIVENYYRTGVFYNDIYRFRNTNRIAVHE